jgi:hypothetical protein
MSVEQTAADVLTAAVEGGTGYWAAVSDIERTEDLDVISVRFHEQDEECEDPVPYVTNHGRYRNEGKVVTIRDVAQAMNYIAAGLDVRVPGASACNAVLRGQVKDLLEDPEEATWDADTADTVVQYAVFGGLVYG